MEQKPEQRKPAKSILSISGTRVNVQNGQLLVSSGIPSVDELLGGGLPVGSVVLIEEDSGGSYSRVMLRYFLAEGVVHKHAIFVGSQDYNPGQMTEELPAVISSDPEPELPDKHQTDKMTIAFRYQKLPKVKKETAHHFGNYYDLSKIMPQECFDNVNLTKWPDWPLLEGYQLSNITYKDLLVAIKDKLEKDKYFINSIREERSILRLALHSLGSPMWLKNEKYSEEECKKDLNAFMYNLRSLLRCSFAVAIVTVPSHLYSESFTSRLYNLCDVAIKLEPFAGTVLENNVALSDFHGYFHLKKMSPINTLVSKHPGSVEYVFKLRRKKFCIEMLHLPPDLGDDDGRHNPKMGCGTGGTGNLDF